MYGMKTVFLSFVLAPVLLAPAGYAQRSTPAQAAPLPDSPDANLKAPLLPTGPTVVFDTSMGRMTCKLYSKEAPETVANFIGLATGAKDWIDPVTHKKVHGRSLYNGTTFHRVIPNFMIQGGDPMGTGEGDPGYMFADEFNPDLNFDVPGRIPMVRSSLSLRCRRRISISGIRFSASATMRAFWWCSRLRAWK
jgi:peptidyl-prolyl cis-trans isomerase A (cyclophilin A)